MICCLELAQRLDRSASVGAAYGGLAVDGSGYAVAWRYGVHDSAVDVRHWSMPSSPPSVYRYVTGSGQAESIVQGYVTTSREQRNREGNTRRDTRTPPTKCSQAEGTWGLRLGGTVVLGR